MSLVTNHSSIFSPSSDVIQFIYYAKSYSKYNTNTHTKKNIKLKIKRFPLCAV